MGQQQLLLLVLGIVIVGIAIVAGIVAFNEGKSKAEHEAIVSDAMRIISDIKAWKLKPRAMGGGESSAAESGDFTGVSLKALGYLNAPVVPGDPYVTGHGCFQLEVLPSGGARVVAYRGSQPGDCGGTPHVAVGTISGTGVNDITWSFQVEP